MTNPVPKTQLTDKKISEIWGNLPQTMNEEQDAIEFAKAIIWHQKQIDATIAMTLWEEVAGGMATEYEAYGGDVAQAILSGHNCK